jgi:hypothetical protein
MAGKLIDSSIYDAGLNVIKNGCTEMYLCSSAPTTRAEAISANLADKTGLTSGSFTGPAAGDVSGRKLTKNAETGITVDANGTVTHIALCSGSLLLAVSTVTSQVLTAGNTVNTPAFDIELLAVTQ